MDAKEYGVSDVEHTRERIEAKREDFAGGPEPGWQQMEQAAADAQQEGTNQGPVTAVSPTASAQDTGQRGSSGEEMPPHNDEHPIGVGQQCFKCGAYNELEAGSCWNCGSELTPSMVETPGVVESMMPAGGDDALSGIATNAASQADHSEGARPVSPDE